jgi:hypothetical protein
MKNILAENMLRFGVKNLSDSNIKVLIEQTSGGEVKSTKISYTGLMTFAKPGDTNPAGYMPILLKGILDAINANPQTKSMLDSQSIKLVSYDIRGGSSNSWAGQTTGFDRELNGTPVQPTKDELYVKNKELARKRAEVCINTLMPELAKKGIKLPDPQTKFPGIINGSVYNTGGKLDPKGQNIQVSLSFRFLNTTEITTITDIKPKFIAHGSYNTIGISGSKTSNIAKNDPKLYALSTNQLTPEQKKDPNRLTAFEVKWNPNVLTNPFKEPWYRWIFIYDKLGKIVRIEGRVYDTSLNQKLASSFANNSNISPNDQTMIYIMNLVSPDYYNKHVKPYI